MPGFSITGLCMTFSFRGYSINVTWPKDLTSTLSVSCRREAVGWLHACSWACHCRRFQLDVLSFAQISFVHNDALPHKGGRRERLCVVSLKERYVNITTTLQCIAFYSRRHLFTDIGVTLQ